MFNKKQYNKKYREKNQKYLKEYRLRNRDKALEYSKQWKKDNPEKVKEINKRYREKHSEYKKQYCKDNREKINIYKKQWRKDNPEYISRYCKKYRMDNYEKVRERERQYEKNRRKTNLKYNLNSKMTHAIGKALKGNKVGRHWETLVGYTVIDLIKRLKKTMPKGYTWQNFMEGRLHIDHKIPKSIFNFTKPEHIDFKRCWALDNLQLLPARENISKYNKIDKPFQPALQLC